MSSMSLYFIQISKDCIRHDHGSDYNSTHGQLMRGIHTLEYVAGNQLLRGVMLYRQIKSTPGIEWMHLHISTKVLIHKQNHTRKKREKREKATYLINGPLHRLCNCYS